MGDQLETSAVDATNNKKNKFKKRPKAPTRVETGEKKGDAEEELTDTIFLRNVSRFDTTQETLKEFMEKNFGETVYCLICKDKETGESKGTAFVKFKSVETATKCLEEFDDRDLQTKFFLDGRNLFVLPALTRDKIGEVKRATAGDKNEVKEKKVKTKPRHNRAKVKPQAGDEVSNSKRRPANSPHQKKAHSKVDRFNKNKANNNNNDNNNNKNNKGKVFKDKKQKNDRNNKSQHHQSPAKRPQGKAPGGGKYKASQKKKVPTGKDRKSSMKKTLEKKRGRHSR